MQYISSKENNLIKKVCKLKEKKYRNEYGEFIIEGAKIIKEAIEEKAIIKHIIINEDAKKSELIQKYLQKELEKEKYIEVPNNIFKLMSDVEKPQGILAVIEKPRNLTDVKKLQGNLANVKKLHDNLADVKKMQEDLGEEEKSTKYLLVEEKLQEIETKEDIILALDNIQDPGNLGTIIRTADSVGLKQILVSKGTTDCYSSKVIRSTMGAIFRVKVIECDNLAKTLESLKQEDYKIMVTSLEAKQTIYDLNLNKNIVVIGNEANGVSKEVLDIADIKAIIPMLGKTESLNASIATGVILYEYVRQKLTLH